MVRKAAAKVAAWTAAGVVGATGVATAGTALSSSGPATAPTAAAAAPVAAGQDGVLVAAQADPVGGAGPAWRHRLARRVAHGELTAKTKDGYGVFDVQRGEVTAVGPTSITLRSGDGFTGDYALTGDTRVVQKGTVSTIGAIKVGDRAALVARVSGGTRTAVWIGDRKG